MSGSLEERPRHEGSMTKPVSAHALVAAVEGPRSDGETRVTMGIRKILIVDDSPTERHVLNDLLTKAGFEVVTSDNGEDAIVKSKQVRPDLILMDVVMPGPNGFQGTR